MARSTNEQNKTPELQYPQGQPESYPEHHAENHQLHHRLRLWLPRPRARTTAAKRSDALP